MVMYKKEIANNISSLLNEYNNTYKSEVIEKEYGDDEGLFYEINLIYPSDKINFFIDVDDNWITFQVLFGGNDYFEDFTFPITSGTNIRNIKKAVLSFINFLEALESINISIIC